MTSSIETLNALIEKETDRENEITAQLDELQPRLTKLYRDAENYKRVGDTGKYQSLITEAETLSNQVMVLSDQRDFMRTRGTPEHYKTLAQYKPEIATAARAVKKEYEERLAEYRRQYEKKAAALLEIKDRYYQLVADLGGIIREHDGLIFPLNEAAKYAGEPDGYSHFHDPKNITHRQEGTIYPDIRKIEKLYKGKSL